MFTESVDACIFQREFYIQQPRVSANPYGRHRVLAVFLPVEVERPELLFRPHPHFQWTHYRNLSPTYQVDISSQVDL